MLIGGALGLFLGNGIVAALSSAASSTIGVGLSVSPGSLGLGVGIMVLGGILAGIFPALQAMRLSIVDALARG